MVNEVLHYLEPVADKGTVIDATVGGGGHARAIIERLAALSRARSGQAESAVRLLGIDLDPDAVNVARRTLSDFDCQVADGNILENCKAAAESGPKPVVWLVHASYVDMARIVQCLGLLPVGAVLFDLGVSWFQLVAAHRGFAYDRNGPLDMRFDQTAARPTAWGVLRRASEAQLREWLVRYGQEPMSGRIARWLYKRRREIGTTQDLAAVVRSAVPVRRVRKALSRVFMVLRMITNQELDNVRRGIDAALHLVTPPGRVLVISYHSGEDRIAKELFRAGQQAGRVRVLTSRPVRPTMAEVLRNPRSRSARLRVAEVVI